MCSKRKGVDQYPMVVKPWRKRGENVIPLFGYLEPICAVIYTTNAIVSLNAQLPKVIKKRGAFPSEDSVRKILYLLASRVSKRWTMHLQDRPVALNFFSTAVKGGCRNRF